MSVKVFGIADEGVGVHDVDERLCGEVPSALSFCCGESAFGLVVLAKF